ASRLERYPNFVVDTSARLRDLALHPRPACRRLFEDFPDRLLFGSDLMEHRPSSQLPERERRRRQLLLQHTYHLEFAFYQSDAALILGGQTIHGLHLPDRILNQFYTTNARRWYPGL